MTDMDIVIAAVKQKGENRMGRMTVKCILLCGGV
jgi:hypothetical protein